MFIMKNSFIEKIIFVGVMLVSIVACQKHDEDAFDGLISEQVKMVITADNAVEDSRTVLNEARSKVDWSAGDTLCVIEHTSIEHPATWFEDPWTEENFDAVESSSANIDAFNKATFTATFSKEINTEFNYYAIYPYSAVYFNKNINSVRITLPREQVSTEKSFDGSADLLVSKPVTSLTQAPSLKIQFKRLVSVCKLNIKGLQAGITISKVAFKAENKALSGYVYVDCETGDVSSAGFCNNTNNNVVINYATPIDAAKPVFFTCHPVEFAEGDSFTLTLTTSGGEYTKKVTLPAGRKLTLSQGDLSTFTVDFSGIAPNQNEELYKVGDLYSENGVVKGFVFAINEDNKGNKWCYVVSKDQEYLQWSTENYYCNCISTVGAYNTNDPFNYWGRDINNYPAFKWCKEYGDGWFLPSSTELHWLWSAITDGENDFNAESVSMFNALLIANGGDPFEETFYMSSNETSESLIEVVTFSADKGVCLDPQKSSQFDLRAAYRFKI